MPVNKGKIIEKRLHAERLRRVVESYFGRNNISAHSIMYAAMLLLAIAWFPVGIADFIDSHWWWFGWLPCSYKLLVSVVIFSIFGWQMYRLRGNDNKVRVDKTSPEKNRALGVFLSTIGRTREVQEKEILKIETALASLPDTTNLMAMLSGKNWEMPLKAIQHHQGQLEALYVFTSKGNPGSSEIMVLFKKVVDALYPGLKIREVIPDGIDFEDVEQVFNKVEFFYDMAKLDGFPEQQIIVDVTGGQKPNSIAASIATLITGRKFQYISTITKEVHAYDVRYMDQAES